MKILLLHNTYQHKGGEDSVLENEYQLLLSNHNIVDKFIFDNDIIQSGFDKIKIGLFSFYNYKSAKILKHKIEEFSPDIIHVHNFFPIASPSIFYVANKMKTPIVMTLHNYRLICPNAILLKNNKICEICVNKSFAIDGVLNSCYRNSRVQTLILAFMSFLHKKKGTWNKKIDKYIALTDFAKNKMINSSLKLENENIVVKPNFVEDNGSSYEKDDYFVFVGRLSVEKGVDLLLKVFSSSNKKLIIIGGGPLEKLVKVAVDSRHNISYLGFKDKEFIMRKLKRAKALIFSSIGYEGMPMTILESLSVGTPVIAPNIGGPNEIIKDGYNGLIYEVSNKKDLQKKINQIGTDDILLRKLSESARKDYENKYTPEKNYEQLIEIYKKAICESN